MKPPYTLERGDLVRFMPPDNAYSPDSAQHQVTGKSGTVYMVHNDSYAHVWFGHQLLLINTSYLQRCQSRKNNFVR